MNKIKKYFQNKPKQSGVTLLELLVATGISSIVMISVMGTVGNIYFSQKKIRFSQNFYTESRILMERISQLARDNTLDYDRYFLEVGPKPTAPDCVTFDERQQPTALPITNNSTERAGLVGGYSSVFYWDTNEGGNGSQDRNLGGMNMDVPSVADPCTQAFYGDQPTLYLINGARTVRTAIRNKDDYDDGTQTVLSDKEDYRVEIQRQLGADTDNDLIADIWGPYDDDGDGVVEFLDGDVGLVWDTSGSGECLIQISASLLFPVLGDEISEDFCAKGHDWTSISPKLMKIDELTFHPSPDRDPFLNFRVDSAQVHPHTFISLTTNLREPGKYGYEVGQQPKMSFQTTVSSRVFGNTR